MQFGTKLVMLIVLITQKEKSSNLIKIKNWNEQKRSDKR